MNHAHFERLQRNHIAGQFGAHGDEHRNAIEMPEIPFNAKQMRQRTHDHHHHAFVWRLMRGWHDEHIHTHTHAQLYVASYTINGH